MTTNQGMIESIIKLEQVTMEMRLWLQSIEEKFKALEDLAQIAREERNQEIARQIINEQD